MEKTENTPITFEKQTKFYNAETGSRGNCIVACYANVLLLNIKDCPAFEELFDCKPNGFWFECINLWFREIGYELKICQEEEEIPDNIEYYFAYGPTLRGVMHQVIYKSGKLFFDPHPSNAGILTEAGFEYIKKL